MIVNHLIKCVKLLWETSKDVGDELIISKRLTDTGQLIS
jgi:hypothetical protein